VTRLTLSFVLLALVLVAPARASVRDAALTGLSCSACHRAGAQLTDIGATHPSIGAYVGDPFRGFEFGVLALSGHEFGSGIPQSGLDSALSLKLRSKGFVVALFHYDGKRNLGSGTDVFHRDALSATASRDAWTLETLFSRGIDAGTTRSSGGLAQLRFHFGTRAFLQVRYEGRADSLGDFVRQTVVGGGVGFRRHARITLEDGYQRSPQSHHVFSV